MRYGNCLSGALVILWRERRNNPRFLIKWRPGTCVPHFMVLTEGGLHHFRTQRDLLPWPLCYLLFEGDFQTVGVSDMSEFEKSRGRGK